MGTPATANTIGRMQHKLATTAANTEPAVNSDALLVPLLMAS